MWVYSSSQYFTCLWYTDTDIDFLDAHCGGGLSWIIHFKCLLSIGRVVSDRVVSRQGYSEYIERVLGQRVCAYEDGCNFPIILEVVFREKLQSLGAAG